MGKKRDPRCCGYRCCWLEPPLGGGDDGMGGERSEYELTRQSSQEYVENMHSETVSQETTGWQPRACVWACYPQPHYSQIQGFARDQPKPIKPDRPTLGYALLLSAYAMCLSINANALWYGRLDRHLTDGSIRAPHHGT
ncbi:hypothetical protein EYF80_001539 [Liparis tanakae]|uniref:Uncharacterized protein n=1 Tax=Liparis tanakae TaxID=230148 RepID=A0A4Z2JEW9_9TELE|nr:hypothetical protein EYF80_001539 [Liparis tanakae]